MSIVHRLFVGFAVCVFFARAQDASSTVNQVCEGLKGAIYSTSLETNEDPCELSCSYDEATGHLLARCRYDYCEACDDNGVCGIREIRVNSYIEQETLQAVLEGGPLNIDTYRFCVDYTEGAHTFKMICSVIDTTSFDSECGSVLTGIPMTTCDASGCDCSASTEPDYNSLYVGFQTLDFGSCYEAVDGQRSASATVITTFGGFLAVMAAVSVF